MFSETPQSVAESTIAYLRHCPDENVESTIKEVIALRDFDVLHGIKYLNPIGTCRSSNNDDHVLYQEIEVEAMGTEYFTNLLSSFPCALPIVENRSFSLYGINDLISIRVQSNGKIFYGTEHFLRSFEFCSASSIVRDYSGRIRDTLKRKENFDFLCTRK